MLVGGTSIGTAPLATKLPMSTDPVKIVARFHDGTEVVQSVVPDRELPPLHFIAHPSAPHHDHPATPTTSKSSPATPAPAEGQGQTFEHDGTMDPFK